MEQEIKKLVDTNSILKEYFKYPKEELEVIRMFFNQKLINIKQDKEKDDMVTCVKTCINEQYDYLECLASFKYKIDLGAASMVDQLDYIKDKKVCSYCKSKRCIIKQAAVFMEEIDKYNHENNTKISYTEVIDFILDRKNPEFKKIPDKSFFSNVDIIDLMFIQMILEGDFIILQNVYENGYANFEYLDISKKEKNEYYINKLIDFYFYKNKNNNRKIIDDVTNTEEHTYNTNNIIDLNKNIVKNLKIDVNNKDEIFLEKNRISRVYKIAAYYKYLIEIEKIDIIIKLREMLVPKNVVRGMSLRAHYFIYKYFQKVEQLPYSRNTKEKIYNILNYILNYRYKGEIPNIPINILIYSNDKEGVENICKIIGEFMWFFGYLSKDMSYYNESMNDIILDKYKIKKLYYNDGNTKNGILLIHNFENLVYTDILKQNLILNILTDEMEKNNESVCTIIYGEREAIKTVISNHYKLSQRLINLELEIDNLDTEKINELVVEKLEKRITVSSEIKEDIYNYIKSTYLQSEIKNMEYVNKLYDRIILNMNKDFSISKTQEIDSKDIPKAYNTKDLPTIMKSLNELVGLTEIKDQINDLVALLKFNKKANIDITNFNLHMVFTGNPGTGKTTVARLIKDIFYNLGYINQNKLVEVTAKDLIAEYLGQTSGKTYNVVKSALGGVLFIDEAYSLTSGLGGKSQYGYESIAMLLKLMEDYNDKLIVIFAGYVEEMQDFLDTNPGLISRIGYKINFPDYTIDELTKIYTNLLAKNKLKITPKALRKLQEIIKESSENKNFGNARYINHIFQKILIEHSKNIENKNKKGNLYQIVDEDINYDKLIAENKKKKIGF